MTPIALTDITLPLESVQVQHSVEQFLFHEAQLLDSRQFDAWIELLAEDLHYWMPVRSARMPRDQHLEFEGPGSSGHYDDTRAQMAQRVRKLNTNRAWSEVPASRTRHLITNVQVRRRQDTDLLDVHSNFLVYRTRSDTYQDSFVGYRADVLRQAEAPFGYLIASRTVYLDQTVVLANNMSVFF